MNLLASEREQFDKRIHEIDFFRGILIILVIFDHLMWFINFYLCHNTSGFLNWYWSSELRLVVRQIVLMAFLFTCGISCFLSRNNKKRGFLLLLLCLGITIVTHLVQLLPMFNGRAVAIDFNVLGVVCLSILTLCIFEKRSTKDILLLTGALMLFYFFILVSMKVNPIYEYDPFQSIIYLNFNPIKEAYVGDYMPLFPYIVFLFLGFVFARKYYINRQSLIKSKKNWERPICFLGRHTLIIYIAHEILFTAVFVLLDLIF